MADRKFDWRLLLNLALKRKHLLARDLRECRGIVWLEAGLHARRVG